MSSRKLIMLLFALLIAVGAIMLARQALQPPADPNQAKKEEPKGPQILAAARDLPAGSLLQEADLKWHVITEEPKEHMVVKDQTAKEDYIGALSRSALKAGDPILNNRVFKAHEQGFLSAALSPGFRAISVKITPVSGLAGLVFPGDHVDVIVAHNVPIASGVDNQKTERRVSETIVVNARVLGLDQKTDDKVTDPKVADVATLEVSPKDAEKIALVSDWNSTLSLVLRSMADNVVTAKPTTATPIEDENKSTAADAQGIAVTLPPVNSFTWDSDVSKVLARPDTLSSTARRVMVIRGKDSAEVNFSQ